MGKIDGGLMGFVRGRIGNSVYYVRNGKQMVRKIGINEKPATPKQLTGRQRFKVLFAFFRHMKPFINKGFGEMAAGTTMHPYNLAVKYNMQEATIGEYPDVTIAYERIVLSKGPLPAPLDLKLQQDEQGVEISWDTSAMEYQRRFDAVMLLLYFPKTAEVLCLLHAAQRQSGEVYVPLNAEALSGEIHGYVAFVAEGKKGMNNSVYINNL